MYYHLPSITIILNSKATSYRCNPVKKKLFISGAKAFEICIR